MTLKKKRLEGADVFRGFVMFLMMAEVLEFQKVSKNIPSSGFWKIMAFNQSHVPWVGCSLHDLIQPSFSFLVGVVVPYSIANAAPRYLNALKRALILIFLGIFLRSMDSQITNFTFEDTLSQIGLGYFFLYVLGFKSTKTIIISIISILLVYSLAFILFTPSIAMEPWPQLTEGLGSHWSKNTNLAWKFDTWFMNLFPRAMPFTHNSGGYSTLSFIPTLATLLLGLLAGRFLKTGEFVKNSLKTILILITAGLLLHFIGICPIVKRIWTPAWVLFSGGLCWFLLWIFHTIVDNRGIKKPFYWLKVIGMNSIAAYVLAHTIIRFIDQSFRTHISPTYDNTFGASYSTLISGTVILLVQWAILHWMYKKQIFIKI